LAIINVSDDGDGVVNGCNRNFFLLNVNLLEEVTFLGMHVVVMLGNIVIALGE